MHQGFLSRSEFSQLISALMEQGYECMGPQVQNDCIVYRSLDNDTVLPSGVEVEQKAASYRVHKAAHERYFSWSNGPQALKPLLFAPQEPLWSVNKDAQGSLEFAAHSDNSKPIAVIGVRACDLAALALQDQHFLNEYCPDNTYQTRREELFLVAVNCTHPSSTCFCHSTGDGPGVQQHYDLLLDELDDGFVLRAGSSKGRQLAARLPLNRLNTQQLQQATSQNDQAAKMQSRSLPAGNLYKQLFEQLDHPHWQDVAERCLACGNCTSVCPTCFCSREFDHPQLDGNSSQHLREWDSCFTEGHSYIHGYTVRPDTRLRYRQWLTHKLGSWHEQYGRSGCVGCGRCISWCPVGIDLTEEVAAVLELANE